jgi:hypothetical protein
MSTPQNHKEGISSENGMVMELGSFYKFVCITMLKNFFGVKFFAHRTLKIKKKEKDD